MDGSTAPKGGEIELQPQSIPAPAAVSEAARTYLSTPFWAGDRARLDPDDMAGWAAAIADVDRMMAPMAEQMLTQSRSSVEKTQMGGVTVYVATPHELMAESADKAHLYIHGGGWAFMCGESVRGQAAAQADRLGLKTYAVDYRNPPLDRFPAALDDCVAVYRALIEQVRPERVVISGGSAGGNLSAATGLRIRDEGLAWPAGIALMTPCTDGSLMSDTMYANDQMDMVLKLEAMAEFWAVYAGKADRRDPYLSPVFADFSKGFPPTLLQTGTRDLLLSDTVRLHRAMRAAGVQADLHVFEAMPHGGFGGTSPEDLDLDRELRAFFARSFARAR